MVFRRNAFRKRPYFTTCDRPGERDPAVLAGAAEDPELVEALPGVVADQGRGCSGSTPGWPPAAGYRDATPPAAPAARSTSGGPGATRASASGWRGGRPRGCMRWPAPSRDRRSPARPKTAVQTATARSNSRRASSAGSRGWTMSSPRTPRLVQHLAIAAEARIVGTVAEAHSSRPMARRSVSFD